MRFSGGETVPSRIEIPHYHGDQVRALFVVAAVVLIVALSTGATLPLGTISGVLTAVALVLAAGITNPAQTWIHWVNALLAIGGTLLFGVAAIAQYRSGENVLDISFIAALALSLLSLLALYFSVRTVRGTLLRPEFR